MKFIITSDAQEQFDFQGKSLGMGHKRGIFYSNHTGKSRLYRQDIISPAPSMSLVEYKDRSQAESDCNKINEAYADNFKVEKIVETGIAQIADERNRQITKLGKTVILDVQNNNHYQLSQAVGLLCWVGEEDFDNDIDGCCPTEWDLVIWRKMMEKPYTERLVIAGALLAAEIDRIQYIENKASEIKK